MSVHKRKQIRDRVIATLTDAVPQVGGRIKTRWNYDPEPEELPMLMVFSADEEAEPLGAGALRGSHRGLGLDVILVANATKLSADEADEIAHAIESAMEADRSQGGLARETNYTGCTGVFDPENNPPIAGLALGFDIAYLA
jgi:hypothetical protein